MIDDMLTETTTPQRNKPFGGLPVKTVEHYEGKHTTSKKLFDKGIGVCTFCNHIISIDTKYCDSCNKPTAVIVI